MAIRQRVLLKNPKKFVAPGGLNFEKHFRLHQQEKSRYYDELARLTDDQRNLRTVTPGYVEGMTHRWIALYHGEVAAAQYMGVAAHHVPLTDCSDFSADAMWESIVGHHTQNAVKYGLRPTLTLDMV